MAVPAELIAGPWTMYVTTSGADHPEISDPVALPWVKLGANLSEDGIAFERDETINEQMTLDSPLVAKLFREKDMLTLTATILDLQTETWARVENGAAVTVQPAATDEGGYREFTIGRGFDIQYYSLLLRGKSPEDNELNLQGLIRYAYISSNGPELQKAEAAGLEVSIMCIRDSAIDGYMLMREQHLAAL